MAEWSGADGADPWLSHRIVSSLLDAVVSIDLDGIVTSWNEGARQLYGFSAEEMIGRSIARVYAEEARLAEVIREVSKGSPAGHADVRRVTRSGQQIVVDETFSPVRDDQGVVIGVASVAHDVSARRRIESELATTRRELERTVAGLQRSNAELEEFAYVASHDLSEPLRAVSGMVQLLSRRYAGQLDDDADEFIAFATEGCERMRAMIDDILAYSRAGRHAPALEDIPLDEVVDDVIAALGAQVSESGAEVSAVDLPVVHTDRRQMHQILQNLVSNALKFRSDDPPRVAISARRETGAWRVLVADNGIGIEPQYRERIFRMFQRLHVREQYPGTGIGLSIVERLVTNLGGSITVDAGAAGGTIFSFTLPDRAEDAA
jgi:PAS domain S-box-containing protein